MKAIISLIAFLFFLSFANSAFAAFSFNIASVSATEISSGAQEIDVNLNIIDLPSESYFRVAIQKESGGSYFGYVKNNNGDWATIQPLNGDCTIYFNVSDTSSTFLALKFKIGDDAIMDNGNYKLKSHRFTKTCTSNTEATNDYSFIVSLPTPTPIPTNTPTPNPTSTPGPTTTPTKTPTLIPSHTPTPTLKLSSSPTPKNVLPTDVLGESTESGLIIFPTDTQAFIENEPISNKTENKSNNWLQKIFIVIGGIFLIICAILFFRFYIKSKKQDSEIL